MTPNTTGGDRPQSSITDEQIEAAAWQPITTAPVGPTIILANEPTGVVAVGYGEWINNVKVSGLRRWIALDPHGVGRFKATHWRPLPSFPSLSKGEGGQ